VFGVRGSGVVGVKGGIGGCHMKSLMSTSFTASSANELIAVTADSRILDASFIWFSHETPLATNISTS